MILKLSLMITLLLYNINDRNFILGIDLSKTPLSPYLIEEKINSQKVRNLQNLKENLLYERPKSQDIFKDAKDFHVSKKPTEAYNSGLYKQPESVGQLTAYNDVISDRKKLTFIVPKGKTMTESITFYAPNTNIDKLALRTIIDPDTIKQSTHSNKDPTEKNTESLPEIPSTPPYQTSTTTKAPNKPPSSTFSYFDKVLSNIFPIYFKKSSMNEILNSQSQAKEPKSSEYNRKLKDDQRLFTPLLSWINSSWESLKYWIQNGFAYLNTSALLPTYKEPIEGNFTDPEIFDTINDQSRDDTVIYSNRLLIGWICRENQEDLTHNDDIANYFTKIPHTRATRSSSDKDPEISLLFGIESENKNGSHKTNKVEDTSLPSHKSPHSAIRAEILEFFGEENIVSFRNIYTRKKHKANSAIKSGQFCSVDLIILKEDLFTPEDFLTESDYDCNLEVAHKTLKTFVSHFSCPKYKEDILFIFPDAPIKSTSKDNFLSMSDNKLTERLLQSSSMEPLQYQQWFLNTPSEPCTGANCFLSGQSNTQSYGIDVYSAWETLKEGGQKVLVAIIDTGVNYLHKDLKSSIWVNQAELNGIAGYDDDGNGYIDDLYGWNFINENNNPMDDNGHGSHIAGIIGANSNNKEGVAGICQSSQIMALKILDRNGDGDISSAVPAIQYAIDNGAQIISNSWGGLASSSRNTILGKLLEKMVDYSDSSVFIMASGNDGRNITKEHFYPASIKRDWSLTVGANSKDGSIPQWSNSGVQNVHLTAPGNKITSTWKGSSYTISSGTSMAAPMATGVSCLILNQYPKLKPQQVVDIMIESTTSMPSHAEQTITSGLLNAYNSLKISPYYFFTLSEHELSLSKSTNGVVNPKSFEITVESDNLPLGVYRGLIEFSYLPDSYLDPPLFLFDYGNKTTAYIVVEMHIVEDYITPQLYTE